MARRFRVYQDEDWGAGSESSNWVVDVKRTAGGIRIRFGDGSEIFVSDEASGRDVFQDDPWFDPRLRDPVEVLF